MGVCFLRPETGNHHSHSNGDHPGGLPPSSIAALVLYLSSSCSNNLCDYHQLSCWRNSSVWTDYPGTDISVWRAYVERKKEPGVPPLPRGPPEALRKCCCFWFANPVPLTILRPWFLDSTAVGGLLNLCLVCGNTWLGIWKYFSAAVIEWSTVVPHLAERSGLFLLPQILRIGRFFSSIIEQNQQLQGTLSIKGREHSFWFHTD